MIMQKRAKNGLLVEKHALCQFSKILMNITRYIKTNHMTYKTILYIEIHSLHIDRPSPILYLLKSSNPQVSFRKCMDDVPFYHRHSSNNLRSPLTHMLPPWNSPHSLIRHRHNIIIIIIEEPSPKIILI